MDKLTTEEKLKRYKEQSRFCALCGKESMFDGCSIQIVSITESGKINTPYDTEMQGMSGMIPMCAYHMILSQQGLFAMTMDNLIISPRRLKEFESFSDSDLRRRAGMKRNNKVLKEEGHMAKAIVEARKFQSEMEKAKGKSPKELIKEFKDLKKPSQEKK